MDQYKQTIKKQYKPKYCQGCGKKLSLKNKWYYVNDKIYCSVLESNKAFFSLKCLLLLRSDIIG